MKVNFISALFYKYDADKWWTVAADSWDYIHTPEIKSLLQVEKNGYRTTELSMKSNGRFEFLLDDLNRGKTDPDTLYAYESSVSRLSLIYNNPDCDYVFKFAAKVPRRFVEMLVRNDPRTLTIVGYFFMLLKTIATSTVVTSIYGEGLQKSDEDVA